MLHECPVALFGGSTESVRLRVKNFSQGLEQTKDLINRFFVRLLRNLKVDIVQCTDYRGNSYAESYYIFSQAA